MPLTRSGADLVCAGCGDTYYVPPSQRQSRSHCSRRCQVIAPRPTRFNREGYVRVGIPHGDPMEAMLPNSKHDRTIQEHRLVMGRHLGRPLTRDEIVHHKNGVRSDNRIENLELWTRSHPDGQRVVDILAWAHEVIAKYETDFGG